MIDFELMFGYSAIMALRYLFMFIGAVIIINFFYRLYESFVKKEINPKLIKTTLIYAVVYTLIGSFLFSGISAPRGVIDVPYKQAPLIESVEIYTPPPRTEKLEGFEPLKNNN